jgi:hypothetical protein
MLGVDALRKAIKNYELKINFYEK